MNYYQKITQESKRRGKTVLKLSLPTLVISVLLAIGLNTEGDKGPAGIFVFFSIFFCILMAVGIRLLIDPIASCPGILDRKHVKEMAADFDAGIIYQDEVITVSNRVIASTRQPQSMLYRDDVIVFWLHGYTQYMNNHIPFHRVNKLWIFSADPKGILEIDVMDLDPTIVQTAIERIKEFCPDVRFGFTDENAVFLRQARKEFKAGKK